MGSSAWGSSATPTGWSTASTRQGVSAHLLYMPGGYCSFRKPRGDGSDLSQLDLAAFLLGTCGSIDEVREAVGAGQRRSEGPRDGLRASGPLPGPRRHRLDRHRVPRSRDPGRGQSRRHRHQRTLPRLAPDQPRQLPGRLGGEPAGRSGRGSHACPHPARARACAAFRPTTRRRPGSCGSSACCGWSTRRADAHEAELLALHVCNAFDIPAGRGQGGHGRGPRTRGDRVGLPC